MTCYTIIKTNVVLIGYFKHLWCTSFVLTTLFSRVHMCFFSLIILVNLSQIGMYFSFRSTNEDFVALWCSRYQFDKHNKVLQCSLQQQENWKTSERNGGIWHYGQNREDVLDEANKPMQHCLHSSDSIDLHNLICFVMLCLLRVFFVLCCQAVFQ